MKPSYLNLCTEFYDLTKPEAGPKEVAFYEGLIRKVEGPVLEAMCGSGRLLIPLMKRGVEVEGVDSSTHMLKSCQERCKAQGLNPILYQQSVQDLSLPKKYALIFIAIGSFQLFYDRMEALEVLKNLYSALLPGGKLVLETFIPWEEIKNSIHDQRLSELSRERSFEQVALIPDNSKIIHKSKTVVYFQEQLEKTESRYEKWIDGICTHIEDEEYKVRWYYRFELELLLEKVRFSSVNILDTSLELNEQALVYIGLR